MKKKENRGGKRKGAGAKPKPYLLKKSQIQLSLKNSTIENLGGKAETKRKLTEEAEIIETFEQRENGSH